MMVSEPKIRIAMIVAAFVLSLVFQHVGIDGAEARWRCMGCP